MSNTSEVFNAFIEASKALDELPKVRADLDAAMQLAHEKESMLTIERGETASLKDELATIKTNLAAKEAELAQATFRSNTLQTVVDTIRGALPSMPAAVSNHDRPGDMPSGAVIWPVDGPEDVASSPQAQGSSVEGCPTVGMGESATLKDTSGAAYAPSASKTTESVHTPLTDEPHTWTNPQLHNPSAAPTPFPWQNANIPPASPQDAAPPSSPYPGPTGSSTPTENPTSPPPTQHEDTHSLEGRDHTGESAMAGSATQSSHSGTDRPYEGCPYYNKPSMLTWAEYKNLGGAVPSWHDHTRDTEF